MAKKNKKIGIQAYVWYLVSGYKNGMEAQAMHSFYFLTDSYSEAYKRALEAFEAYRMIRTKDPKDTDYYGLDYEIQRFSFEQRILD